MSMQLELFPGLDAAPAAPAGPVQPRLWIKRLVIWERPGEVLREVTLRRGLNVIWSPDPGAAAAVPGSDGESGHGAGKSLFCRLLRYCLGEESFGPDALRARVVSQLEHGHVGAELSIAGRDWAVVRSLGRQRRHLAREGATAEALLAETDASAGLEPMLDAIRREVLPPDLDEVLPGGHALRAWLYALAWLSRDQECRYARLLDWRSARTDSRSPALRLSRQDASDVLRTLVGAMSAAEARLRARRAAVEDQKQGASRQARRLELLIDESHARVRGVIAEALGAGGKAGERNGKAMLESGPIGLAALRKQAEAALRKAGEGDDGLGDGLGDGVPEENLGDALGDDRGGGKQGTEAGGAVCPLCGGPAPRSLAHDTAAPAPAKPAPRRPARQQHARRERWFRARRLLEQVDELDDLTRALTEARETAARMDEELGTLQERQEAHRRQHARVVARLSALYDSVVKGIAGHRARARLDLTGRGIAARVELGGDRETVAMDSLKTLAFDIAALLLSLEGHGATPAFLIHDSPREADLGLSLYHRLFRFMAAQEPAGEEPPFQYIITTTTEPPEELREQPYLVARLGGADARERLLRRDL